MSGKFSRDKGARREREVVAMHREIGVHAERVPLSGAAGGRYSGDVAIYARAELLNPFITEVKARSEGNGFKSIRKWLGQNDALFLKEDRQPLMVVIPWAIWAELIGEKNDADTQSI